MRKQHLLKFHSIPFPIKQLYENIVSLATFSQKDKDKNGNKEGIKEKVIKKELRKTRVINSSNFFASCRPLY